MRTKWKWNALMALLIGAYLPALAGAASAQVSSQTGLEEAAAPRQVVLRDLPRISADQIALHPPVPEPRSIANYDELKERLARQGGVSLSLAPPPSQPSTNTPGASVSFTGQDETCSNLIPSDMALAVNNNFVVQIINACINVYDKTGVIQPGFPKSTNTFLGLPPTAFTFDPRAQYDWVQNRFVVVIDEYDSSTGTIWVAASQTNNPTGAWNIYGLGVPGGGTTFGDYPTLGQDRQAIYVGMNRFTSGSGPFIDDAVLYLPKAPIYSGGGFSYFFSFNFNLSGTTVDTIQPANVMNIADNPRAEFMVNSLNINFGCTGASPCNTLVVWAVSNPLVVSGTPGPEVSAVVINTANNYSFPPNARQPGCPSGACLLNTLDNRISGGIVYGAGSIWGAWETAGSGGNPGATLIWVQLRPYLNDGNPACTGAFTGLCADIFATDILNEDCFFCGGRGANGSNYYGTLQSDPEGNVTMVYNYSDDNFFPGTAYNSRRVTQLRNTMHDAGIFLVAGGAFYQQLDLFGRNRWGDYTATAPDLTNPAQVSMWFSGEFSVPALWRTQIGANGFVLASDL